MTIEVGRELTPATVLRRRGSPDVEYVEVDGETVVYNCGTNGLHLLDPIGSILWGVLDGTGSLHATSVDLAAVFGRPTHEVLEDVLAFAHHLQEADLVETIQ